MNEDDLAHLAHAARQNQVVRARQARASYLRKQRMSLPAIGTIIILSLFALIVLVWSIGGWMADRIGQSTAQHLRQP